MSAPTVVKILRVIMRTIDCIQGSAEWLAARCGKITASRMADVLSVLKKGGEGADRRNYRIELIAERLSGRYEDHYVSPEMAWGSEFEEMARAAYEIQTGTMADTAGFVLHPCFDFAGASPDALIGDDGGLEIKCPKTTTHIRWMMAGTVPEEHQPQMLWNMACCERAWWDFVSFDPRLPEGLKTFIVRLPRDEARIAEMECEVERFNEEVEAAIAALRPRIREAHKPKPSAEALAEFEEMFGEIVP